MPAAGWNGKFQAVGNGGWSGAINRGGMTQALLEGYATASTDTGHSGGRGTFALGHPEKLIDFAHRSEHEMTVKAKALIAAYYGKGPRYSYWNGCSSGGKQGLKEAQKYPGDYDGIVAGAPANYWTHLLSADMWLTSYALKEKERYLPKEKYAVLNSAVMTACDALDGIKDGILNDPRKCRFDPSTLLCRGAEEPGCLTSAQVETAKVMYSPAKDAKTGKLIYPALQPGSELGWSPMAGGPDPFSIPLDHFRYVVFENPDWDWRTFDLSRDTALADEKDRGLLNAIDPDLKAFKARGGKLLIHHGWNDNLIAPENSINYYNSVLEKMGPKQGDFVRLFMAPGMGHCSGGPGPNQFNAMAAMERWVEAGIAPDRIEAFHVTDGRVDMTRPLCPYPQVAVWKGAGSTNDAGNFVCRAPK
jgi:feruloyl esterase